MNELTVNLRDGLLIDVVALVVEVLADALVTAPHHADAMLLFVRITTAHIYFIRFKNRGFGVLGFWGFGVLGRSKWVHQRPSWTC